MNKQWWDFVVCTQHDLGQATANMMLVAADLGIGSAHAAARDQELARRVLGGSSGRAGIRAFSRLGPGPCGRAAIREW